MNELLLQIEKRLQEAGIECFQAEALIISEALLGRRRNEILQAEAPHLDEDLLEQLEDILTRRSLHEPLQYILGRAPFMDVELLVTPATLIPRPETEILVEYIIEKLPPGGRLLDLGTGSGAIAVAVAKARPDADVMGLDISEEALEVAKRNAKLCGADVEFVESDLFSEISSVFKFDFIAANLPYVSEREYARCAPEITRYEPKLALVADNDGLSLMLRAAEGALNYLKTGGVLGLEIGSEQGPGIAEHLRKLGFCGVEIRRDYNRFDRFVTGVYSGENPC